MVSSASADGGPVTILLLVWAIIATLLLAIALVARNEMDRVIVRQLEHIETLYRMVSNLSGHSVAEQSSLPQQPFIPWWAPRQAPQQEIEPEESHIPASFGPDHDDWSEPALPQAPVLAAKSKLRELDEEPGILPKPEPSARP